MYRKSDIVVIRCALYYSLTHTINLGHLTVFEAILKTIDPIFLKQALSSATTGK